MNELRESVALPDIAEQRYVHPVDLPEARNPYVRGWWFGRVGSIPVVVAVGALVWAIGGNVFGVAAAALSVLLIGVFVGRVLTNRAWEHIPRKRQDRTREPWSTAAAAIDAAALVVIALAVLISLQTHPLPDEVVAYAVGSGAGIVLLQIVELVVAVLRGRSGWRMALLVAGVAVAVALVAAFGVRAGWGEDLVMPAVLGAVIIVLVQLGWWAVTGLASRRRDAAVA
ncbi:hypothetical protein [Agromyces archimandritae]|uniref:Uncharacterized protein n=1 Tax=Agromyces archimandritae TaxID=2781962 RepID=A0A975FQN1_9MICO|nr:hypothetical protein [Agromyces archimandritae]QTX06047.1 hypothetical protein G127AT_07700 [Agromyces archimandritae]